MKHLFIIILAALFVSFMLATCVYAEVPHLIRFQGKVTHKDGKPLHAAYNITFRIYDTETGGTLEWSETQNAVPVNNGIFTVLLGNENPFETNLFVDNPDLWLSMEVDEDGEMSPRQRISSVGYAIHAEVADSIADVSVIPQGAIIMIKEAYPTPDGCPVGYRRVGELDGKFIVGGASYNPGTDDGSMGSNTHEHEGKTGSHTLTIAEIPSHNHNITFFPHGGGGGIYPHTGEAWDCYDPKSTGTSSVGGGQGHTHPILPADSRPEFATVILCEKE